MDSPAPVPLEGVSRKRCRADSPVPESASPMDSKVRRLDFSSPPHPAQSSRREDMMLKTLGFSTFLPLRSAKKLTAAAGPDFQTAKRARQQQHMNTSWRARSPFVSRAQFALNFQRKTPARFHTCRRRPGDKPLPLRFEMKMTQPVTPKFVTDARTRATEPSTEQRELMEATHQFHANPVNLKALNSTAMVRTCRFSSTMAARQKVATAVGARSQQPALPPKPMAFRAAASQPEPKPFAFKAPPTHAGHEVPAERKEGRQELFVFKGDDASSQGAPQAQQEKPRRRYVVAKRRRLTVPKPFGLSTELRGEQSREEMLRKLERQRKEEEDARHFVAQEYVPPPQHTVRFAETQGQKITVPKPFHLESEVRGEAHTQKFLKTSLERNTETFQFKAQPYAPPPEPKQHTKSRPLARIENVVLNSDKRASVRAEFEEQLRMKEKIAAERNAQRQAEQEERERREIAEMRKRMIHHAMPILPDAIVEIKPSGKITVPKSPRLQTKARAQALSRSLRLL